MTITLTLSQEAGFARQSIIRDLIGHAVDPEIISFAAGLPPGDVLPVADFQACVDAVLRRDGAIALQYGPQYMPLREWVVAYMQRRGVTCTPQQVYITNGSQQSLTILSRLFLDPGAPAVVEAATFTGINLVTGGRGAEVRAIPTDLETGADVEALEAAFKQAPIPRLAVLISDFHNPLGVSMSVEKRQRAAALSNEYGVPLIEDDPYALLRFEGEIPPPMKSFDAAETVFYLGSFSKILAPGLRVGFIVAPPAYIPKIGVLRESIDLETSTLMQRAIAEFMGRGLLEPHLERVNATNRERAAAMLAALDDHLGGIATWTKPQGGLFVWVELPQGVDTLDMLKAAIADRVVYIPGWHSRR